MTVRLLIACDSRPAPYAGGDSWPCRAYLPTDAPDIFTALDDAVRYGWRVEARVDLGRVVTTCPACVRAFAALAQVDP